MSTDSTMINDRYCWNCGLAEHDCDSNTKEDFHGYCTGWKPTVTDRDLEELVQTFSLMIEENYENNQTAFYEYMDNVCSQLECNSTEDYRRDHIVYGYSQELVNTNTEYFKKCFDNQLSAYKALLFFGDYLNGDYVFN